MASAGCRDGRREGGQQLALSSIALPYLNVLVRACRFTSLEGGYLDFLRRIFIAISSFALGSRNARIHPACKAIWDCTVGAVAHIGNIQMRFPTNVSDGIVPGYATTY